MPMRDRGVRSRTILARNGHPSCYVSSTTTLLTALASSLNLASGQ